MGEQRRIARVFPRRVASATPTDADSFVDLPEWWIRRGDYAEVHVSVTFTWDLPRARFLAAQWKRVAPVRIGGPALGDPGGEFVPGMYLKPGHIITSRGCPNRCELCLVPEREGRLREYRIWPGWNVLDNNLLACSMEHQEAVFRMLLVQPQAARFTGGFEARRFTEWHAEWMAVLRPEEFFFAYDRPGDLVHVERAAGLLDRAGLLAGKHRARCYVLVGYDGDTFAAAESRVRAVLDLGVLPMAMLWNRGHDLPAPLRRPWREFVQRWIRPRAVGGTIGKPAAAGQPERGVLL